MRGSAGCVGRLVALAVAAWGSAGWAQPAIGKDQIPADLPAEVRQKIEALYSADAEERARATGEVVSTQFLREHTAAAVPFLMAMLHDDAFLFDEKELVRREMISSRWRVFSYPNSPGESAAEVLAGIGRSMGKPGMKPLVARLTDENAVVRANVLRVLGELLGHNTEDDRRRILAELAIADALIECLDDREAKVRHNAAVVLRYVEDPRAVDPLIGLVEKETAWEARMAAAIALGVAKQPRAVEALAARLKDPKEHEKVRAEAIHALGQIGDPRALQPLVDVFEDTDPQIRRAVIQALASVIRDPDELRPILDHALLDPDWQVRDGTTAALLALDKLGDSEGAFDLLLRTIGDGHPNVRADAARALGQLGNLAAVPPLIALMRGDNNGYVRWHAADALGAMGDSRAIGPLNTALEDEEETVRSAARRALEAIDTAVRSRGI